MKEPITCIGLIEIAISFDQFRFCEIAVAGMVIESRVFEDLR